MKDRKREGGERAKWKTDCSLGPSLLILSFAVGCSDEAHRLHFTEIILPFPCFCISLQCSWTLNDNFFVSNVIDVCMQAGRESFLCIE